VENHGYDNSESLLCVSSGNSRAAAPIRLGQELIPMLMIKERRPAIRTLRGWAILLLQEAGAIRECELHSWIQDRADPHARQRALALAEEDPPAGVSPAEAVAEIREVLDSIGDTCPECPPED
jgi:hypothetical protein